MKTLLQVITPRVLLVMMFFSFAFSLSANDSEPDDCAEEEVAFTLFCPPTIHLDCTDELWDLDWLENAYYHDYTGYHDAGKPHVKWYLNDCNVGYIIREWAVEDYNWNWHKCTQKIYVGGNSFDYKSIKWPKDVQLTGCNPGTDPSDFPPGKDKPVWNNWGASCSKIGVNFHDKIFTYGPGCYEIIRTWSIVDCCIFNPYYNTGIWTYNQRITVTSTYDSPQVWVPYDVHVETSNCKKAFVVVPELEVKDGCDEQYIITNNSPYALHDGPDATGYYPVGTTKVRFMVKYNCWESKFYYVNVTVSDNSTPVPYCYYGKSTALMGVDTDDDGIVDDGMVEIWASDLDAGSYVPCRPGEKPRLSFSSDPNDNVRVFTCEDVGEKEINIWVTDKYGKQDYCTTFIDIQNNAANIPNCEPLSAALISGNISSLYGNTEELILEVNSTYEGMKFDTTYAVTEKVTTGGQSESENGNVSQDFGLEEEYSPIIDTTMIYKDFEVQITEGEYMLEGLDLNEDYTLTLRNEKESASNIDQNDVIALSAYLEGTISLSMYQKLAADVNHDMMIDEKDLALLTDFVEGKINASALDVSWITYDPDFNMPESTNTDIDPYPTKKVVEINNRNAVNVELMIFQMGDLSNGSSVLDLINKYNVSEREIKGLRLETVAPNPFTHLTNFSLNLEENQQVTLNLFDMNGKAVLNRFYNLNKGRSKIEINSNDLNTSGIYFYQLSTAGGMIQGKLILVE